MRAKLLQSCLILCDPVNCSLPIYAIRGIFQARVLEWKRNESFKNTKFSYP